MIEQNGRTGRPNDPIGNRTGFWTDESGATAIEYATIASLLSITIAVVVGQIGSEVSGFFTSVVNSFG